MNNRYLVKTPDGFKHFDKVSKKKKYAIKIYFDDNSDIGCSIDHPFIINGNIIRVSSFDEGDMIGDKKIIKIEQLGQQDCYDLLNVEGIHQYFTNGLISHNSFLGSSYTLIKSDTIQKFKSKFEQKEVKIAEEIQLHPDFEQTKINMYVPPQKGRAYIIGGDPATGTENDFHAMSVWDITDMYHIELVADFYCNNLPPKYFAYVLAKTATLYNLAYIAIENNGVSYATLDKLCNDFSYENIIYDGGNRLSLGITSSDSKKLAACICFKQFIEDPLREILIYNGSLIEEMEHFEQREKAGSKTPRFGCFTGHDDFMMTMIWAFYYLQPSMIESYYEVKKYATDKLGNEIPLIVSSCNNVSTDEIRRLLFDIDNQFKSNNKGYEIDMQELQKEIEDNQKNLMSNFKEINLVENQYSDDENASDDKFDWDGFVV